MFEGGCFATTISQSHDAAGSQIIARIWLTLRKVRSGDYRVNFRDGNETTAYYTDNLEDAVKTAVEMARTRDVMQAVDEAVATEPLQDRIADMPLNPRPPRRKWRSELADNIQKPRTSPQADVPKRLAYD